MCGINGFVQFYPKLKEGELGSIIKTMNRELIHRGPDQEGMFLDKRIGLGMRRLSIIDLTSGDQPIFNEDESLVIVMNGEIYNYKKLRIDLQKKGHTFRTASDTEVVIHTYEEYGANCLDYLDGMFVFAIFDKQGGTLFLARDRAGEKPLYYRHDKEYFIFSSELKSISKVDKVGKTIDPLALSLYFQLAYIPAPYTIYNDVKKLEPASYMILEPNGDLRVQKYWDIDYSSKNQIVDYLECKKKLRTVLFESVEQCMVSDVPIGVFLSGGIDSTIITGIMSKIQNKPINTFTIGYNNKEYDESQKANIVAKYYKTNHHSIIINFDDVFSDLDFMMTKLDEPFADPSAIPTFLVSKYASNYVKVALGGDGGDELFAGYNSFTIDYYANKYKRIPSFLRKNCLEKLMHLIPECGFIKKINKITRNSDFSLFEMRKNLFTQGFRDFEVFNLFRDKNFKVDLSVFEDNYNRFKGSQDEISQILYVYFKLALEGQMLAKTDRMCMLNSLELRAPILGRNVVELAMQIPSAYKIKGSQQKIILKDTFRDLIPGNLLNAPKMGFCVPIDDWLRGPLKKDLEQTLNKELIISQGLFDECFIEKILGEHMSKKRDRQNELWALYVFQKWYVSFVK